MSIVSGQTTLDPGNNDILIGIAATKVWFFGGTRDGVTETNPMFSVGHADSGYQFSRAVGGGKSRTDQSNSVLIHDTSGNVVVKGSVTVWGSNYIRVNATSANSNYPVTLVAET